MLHKPMSPTSGLTTASLTKTALPSVSVCIQAHEETFMERLGECLEHVLASDYPKLEILVLNELLTLDPSKELKRFAHKGVRFVPTADGAAPQNHDDLLRQASGTLVCFVDLDTHLEPHTLGQMVERFMSDAAAV